MKSCVRRGKRYASDCSGAEAPLRALEDIGGFVWRRYRIPFPLKYLFASEDEAQTSAQVFLTLNSVCGPPQVLFSDMFRRIWRGNELRGPCCYAGADVAAPGPVDHYVCGFVCRDLSMANTKAPKPLVFQADDESGLSSRTLAASMEFVGKEQPLEFYVENIFRRSTVEVIQQYLIALPMYDYVIFLVDSADVLPVCRLRLIAVAVNVTKAKVLLPLCQWAPILQAMFGSIKGYLTLEESLYEEGSIEVAEELERLKRHRKGRRKGTTEGDGWERDFEKHQTARAAIANLVGEPTPSCDMMAAAARRDPSSCWSSVLPVREADKLRLNEYVVEKLVGFSPRSVRMVWDLTPTIAWTCRKSSALNGMVCTVLRNHR